MQITQDKVSTTATQADADANDSRIIADTIDIRLSPAARMPLATLIAAAEQVEAELEARFAAGDLTGATAERHTLGDLILRVASAPAQGADLAERRVHLLARNWRVYRDSSRRSVQEAIIAAALHADCDAHGFSIGWVNQPPRTLH